MSHHNFIHIFTFHSLLSELEIEINPSSPLLVDEDIGGATINLTVSVRTTIGIDVVLAVNTSGTATAGNIKDQALIFTQFID